jgi:hypothetical protein
MPTDEQIIDRIRKARRYRRAIGVACAALGLVMLLAVIFVTHRLHAQSDVVFREIGRHPRPTTQDTDDALGEARFGNGFALGFICAGGLAAASSLIVNGGFWFFATNRRDTLLLKYWDIRPKE